MSLEKPQKKPASKSQQIRFRLFDLWSLQGNQMPFEMFYESWADTQLEKIERQILHLSHPEIDDAE